MPLPPPEKASAAIPHVQTQTEPLGLSNRVAARSARLKVPSIARRGSFAQNLHATHLMCARGSRRAGPPTWEPISAIVYRAMPRILVGAQHVTLKRSCSMVCALSQSLSWRRTPEATMEVCKWRELLELRRCIQPPCHLLLSRSQSRVTFERGETGRLGVSFLAIHERIGGRMNWFMPNPAVSGALCTIGRPHGIQLKRAGRIGIMMIGLKNMAGSTIESGCSLQEISLNQKRPRTTECGWIVMQYPNPHPTHPTLLFGVCGRIKPSMKCPVLGVLAVVRRT